MSDDGGNDGDAAARIAGSWDANAAAWTETVRGGHLASRRLVTDRAVVDAVLARAPRRVLDVGCGEGWLVRALSAAGVEATGTDGSAELVRRATEAGGGRFLHLRYDDVVRDPAALGGPYDVAVFSFALLDREVAPLLAAVARALAPGGAVVIQTVHPFTACGDAPYRDGWREERFDGFGAAFAAPMPWYYRTVASWVGALGEAGLSVEGVDEPLHPETGRPASLLLVAAPAGARG